MFIGVPREAGKQGHRGGRAPASVYARDAGVILWK